MSIGCLTITFMYNYIIYVLLFDSGLTIIYM